MKRANNPCSIVKRGLLAALFVFTPASALAQEELTEEQIAGLRGDAEWLLDLIDSRYAYLDRFDGVNPARGARGVDVDSINSAQDLLTFGECALMALQDHHAFMGLSNSISPGLAPSFSDLWIDQIEGQYVVAEVRSDTPAQRAGVQPGWRVTTINGDTVDARIDQLCGGPFEGAEARSFAARMVSVGPQRDEDRLIGFETPDGDRVELTLSSMYAENQPWPGPITHEVLDDGILVLSVHDSLGETGWIADVDRVMNEIVPGEITGVVLDLRDTPGGGGTDNARALMGRFVNEVTFYQRHTRPDVERLIDVPRTWVEEVSPLAPDLSDVPVVVIIGRWTGSMGEGTAIGFQAAADATLVGTQMAQLRGAVDDFPLPFTGWNVKLPFEGLYHVNGTPREATVPDISFPGVEANPTTGEDRGMDAALAELRRQIAEGLAD